METNRVGEREGAYDAGLDAAVGTEQIRLLIHKRFDLPINLLNAGIVSAALWPLYSLWVMVTWLGFFCAMISARSLIRRRCLIDAPGVETAQRWGRIFAWNAFATGCLWGLTASVILVTPNPLYHVFIVFVLGGMMAGGIVSNAASMPAMLAFMLPTILPVIAVLVSRRDLIHIEMGVMLSAFTAVLVITGRNINRSVVENFRLRIAQDILLVKLQVSEAVMAQAQEMAHVGSWQLDVGTKKFGASAEAYRMFGLDPDKFNPTYEAVFARVHPSDRAMVEEKVLASIDTGAGHESHHRIMRDGGEIRHVHEITHVTCDPTGNALKLTGTIQDVSERRQAEDAMAYRDRLLHAVTLGTGILVKAESLTKEMPKALRIVGESMQVDRVLIMQEALNLMPPPTLRYMWQVQDILTPFDLSAFLVPASDMAELAAWREQLKEGKPLVAQLATSVGPVRAMLESFQNQSTLIVPIFVGDKLWGTLGIDSCSVARDWTRSEIDTIQTFSDIAGALIVHNETLLSLERSEERFRVLGATAQDAIIMMEGAGRISSWNRAAERILGYSEEEAVGKHIHHFLAPERYRLKADQSMEAFVSTGQGDALGKTTELTAIRKNGTEIAVELSLAGAQVGDQWQAIGILRDITERKAAEKRLQFANLLLTTEMEASPDGILVVDANRKVISSNKRFTEIWRTPKTTLTAAEDVGVLAAGIALVKNPEKFAALVQNIYDHPGNTSHDEFEMLDGRFIERHTVMLLTAAGEYLGRIWFFRDITESKQYAARALRIAHFDALTGLANRSVFVEALWHAVIKVTLGEKGFAVIYLDLDHFKDVNDTLGHAVGDALLQAVADRLQSNTRESDTVARFGGDEFAVVAGDIGEPADAARLANKLINVLGEPYLIQGNQIYSGASIGIDLYGPESSDAETLLSHADVALYRAKSEGRGRYRFFTDAMDAEVRMQVSLGTELHEALSSGQLFLLYQPQVAIDSARIIGVEALVRWRHPLRGILGPGLFIPVAEKTGFIGKLGHWVLLTACRQAKAWLDSGIAPVRIAVNLSGLQFKSPNALETDVADILAETELPPRLLELELTETVLMNASREHGETIGRLRQVGVTFAIDDFGTGYSSLEYLRRFPADRIKIAQNFVRHLETMPGDASIVKATIGLAHELGIMVIAEGVETREQLDLLKQWGCSEVQGFYFAKPLAAEEITLLLHTGFLQPKPGESTPSTS